MVYVEGEKYKKLYSVSTQTLRSWADTGKVESVRTPGGVRLYKLPEAQHLQLQNQAAQLSISYIRVSSGKQKDDLERQRTFMLDRFPDNEVIADIGSGVNWVF